MPTPLDTLLTQSDPLVGDPSTLESHARLTELSAMLAREVVQADRTLKGRRLGLLRRHKWATAAAAALVIVPTSAYAASHFLAQTGQFGNAAYSEEDGSEWIDTCAADFPAFFRTLPQPTDASPTGLTWASIADQTIRQRQDSSDCQAGGFGAREQVTGLKATYYHLAEGIWTCRAVQAQRRGDFSGFRSNASSAAVMMDRLDELGIWGDDNWKPVRDALRAGDIDVITQSYEANDMSKDCQ